MATGEHVISVQQGWESVVWTLNPVQKGSFSGFNRHHRMRSGLGKLNRIETFQQLHDPENEHLVHWITVGISYIYYHN